MRVRLLTPADLPAAMALKQAAGWNQTEEDWRLLLELEPDGCFAVEIEGQVVASATAYCYERELAWIGMVLALPEVRGRGFGWRAFRAAVDFCRDKGVRRLKLDATDMGLPLYEDAGFLPEYHVERWGGLPRAQTSLQSRERERAVTTRDAPLPHPAERDGSDALVGRLIDLSESRLESLLARDSEAFGVNRGTLLRVLRRKADWTACLERDGTPVAYAMSRPGAHARYFGPCVAETADDARLLLRAFIADYPNERVFVDIPAANSPARSLLASYGLEVRRMLLRMHHGPNDRPGTPSQVFGLAGFEYG